MPLNRSGRATYIHEVLANNPHTLSGEELQVHVSCTVRRRWTGAVMICEEDAMVPWLSSPMGHGGGTGKRNAEVEEQLPEVLDVLTGVKAGHRHGFGRATRHGALNMGRSEHRRGHPPSMITITMPVIERGSPRTRI
jgi:hypothetical protein